MLEEKYLNQGETWATLAERVSGIMNTYDERDEVREAIYLRRFIPSTPILLGAGHGRNMMACHALVVENSILGIMNAGTASALAFKSGAGVGLELTSLSPEGTKLAYAPTGHASGPVSFLKIFDAIAQVVMSGGLRRAAMLAALNVQHPDILKFIVAKERDGTLANFNLSVTFDNGPGSAPAGVLKQIVSHAHLNGEPGAVFLDNVNRNNPLLSTHGRLIAPNACAEQMLYNYGSCCLAHIVLPRVIPKLGDYGELAKYTHMAVRFLDRVISVNSYILPEMGQLARGIRNIGLGVMGLADLFKNNGIPFAHPDALVLSGEISERIYQEADKESSRLAELRGGYRPGERRNSFLMSIAPTGHTSRLAGVDPSIYPPFKTALEMSWQQHLFHVAAWQAHIDGSISYTVNLRNDASLDDVREIFFRAHALGLKAISVYRDRSRAGQPYCVECT